MTVAGLTAILTFGAFTIAVSPAQSQTNAVTSKFEAASIRRVGECSGDGGAPTPARLTECAALISLIDMAYVQFANGRRNLPVPIRFAGGPDWIFSDFFQIDATAQGNPSQETIRGPMLQALLEDQFKLKAHRETQQVEVYALTVARGGPKLQPLRKGTSVEDWSMLLAGFLGRPVIDRTGIAGLFDFRLELAPDTTILSALQEQLGLQLDTIKTPTEFLVIDRVERPSAN